MDTCGIPSMFFLAHGRQRIQVTNRHRFLYWMRWMQRENLKKLTFSLLGVHNALLKGDFDGHDVGKRIILPASSTGGPRYMYKHYEDALAKCRVHGNPQYFMISPKIS
ncbi:putative DNA helicase [Tanacetum coccineum]